MSQDPFQRALEIVKGRTKKAIYETWFSRLVLLSASEDVATIGTPNRFVKEWIQESELIHVLASGLKEAFGQPLTPSLVITERSDEEKAESGLLTRPSALLPEAGGEPGLPSPPRAAHDALQAAPTEPIARPLLDEAPDAGWSVPLKRDYVFENYVVGPSNRLSHAAALAVAQSPGQAYNPLFLHSASGLGKTHLLQAICSELLARPQRPKILYLSCEDFVNQFIEAVKDNGLEGFRGRLRGVDMLLIDDIHFLADKPRIQEEFFHTFNTLYNSQKQIVLSADCHPGEIPTLQDRLVSRFKWGLVSRIDTPEYETRAAIIKSKSGLRGVALPDDVVSLLAARITTNIREAEGALNRLLGTSKLLNRSIDAAFALEVLADLLGESSSRVAIEDILDAAVQHFDVKVADLKSKKRTKKIAFARQICMYLARDLTELTLQDIGKHLGGRDHTTVLYALDKIGKKLGDDPNLSDEVQNLSRAARQRATTTARLS